MNINDFLNIALKIAKETPTKYQLGGVGQHEDKYFLFDCIGLIKSILWGFNFDYSKYRGGAIYCSNDVPDLGANSFFEQCCNNKSTDFKNIEIGELVWMNGHIGIYADDKKVIEATSAWTSNVLISDINDNGDRSFKGYPLYKWTHHGKCNFLNYNFKYNVGDMVILNGYYHKSKDANSECLGEIYNYVGEIKKIEDGEYPYYIKNLGWVREKYLSPYDGVNYEELYMKEVIKNKELQEKIDKAISDLK